MTEVQSEKSFRRKKIKPTLSLRRRVLRHLIRILTLTWIASTIAVLGNTWFQANNSYTDQVELLAETVASTFENVTETRKNKLSKTVSTPNEHNYFLVVRQNNKIIYQSENAPPAFVEAQNIEKDNKVEWQGLAAQAVNHGLKRDIFHNSRWWRVAEARSQDGTFVVWAGVAPSEPFVLAIKIAWGVALPMFLGFVALIITAFFGVRRGLEPVDRVKDEISSRSFSFLEPIDSTNIPKELKAMVDSLNNLFLRLRTTMELEQRFVADASHELRTPLTAIKAHIQNLELDTLTPEIREGLEKIRSGVDRSTRLIEQLLTLARVERATIDHEGKNCNLKQVCSETLAELFPEAVRLNTDIQFEGSDAVIAANSIEIGMLVRNLSENALRHAGEKARVFVSCGKGDTGGGWLKVEDSGPSIQEKEREALFARFRRGTTKSNGAGLGLSIVQAIADRAEAQVNLKRSDKLGGLLVEVLFPDAIKDE